MKFGEKFKSLESRADTGRRIVVLPARPPQLARKRTEPDKAAKVNAEIKALEREKKQLQRGIVKVRAVPYRQEYRKSAANTVIVSTYKQNED